MASELVVEMQITPPAALHTSPEYHLWRVAMTHARYLRHNSGLLGRGWPQARRLSNKIHYSPADPDARISVKRGKARAQLPVQYGCGRGPWRYQPRAS